jgi:uncharacterized damage-inducible protein DinB
VEEARRALQAVDRLRGVTIAAVQAAPPDKMDWAPVEGLFTFGEQARHIAASQELYTDLALGKPVQPGRPSRDAHPSQSAIVDYLAESNARAQAALAALTPADLERTVTMRRSGTVLPVIALLWRMAGHEEHHKGALFVYLRLLGITPPSWWDPALAKT